MAQIEVFYKPVVIANVTTPYYHEYLVYTDDNGNQFITRGGPNSNQNSGLDSGGGSGSSGSGSGSGPNVPFGNITTIAGVPYQPGVLDYVTPGTNPGVVLLSGDQATVAAAWNQIVAYASSIPSENIPYGFAGPNSNTVVNASLAAAGLPAPPNEGLNDLYPAPGANVPLSSADIGSAVYNTLALISDYAGREISAVTTSIEDAAESASATVKNALASVLDAIITSASDQVESLFSTPGDGMTTSTNADGSSTIVQTMADGSQVTSNLSSSGNLMTITYTPTSGAQTNIEVGDGAAIDSGNGANTLVSIGNNEVIQAGSGTNQVVLTSTNSQVNLASGSQTNVFGDNDSNALVTGSDGTAVTLDGASATVRLGNDVQLTDNTNGGIDAIGSNSTAVINGNQNTLTTGNDCGTAEGCVGNTLNTANSTVSVNSTDSTVVVSGSGNTITGTSGSQITLENTGSAGDGVTGNDLTVVAGQGVNANITGTGDAVTENGSGGSIGVFNDGTSADTVILNGDDKYTNVQTDQADPTDGSVSVTVTGDRDYVGLLGNSGYTVSLSNGQIETWNGTSFSATGTGDTIGTGSGETITLNGSGNTLSAGSNVTLTDFGSGDIDTVGAGSNGYINNAHDMLTKGTGSDAAFQVGYDAGTASGTGGFNLVGPNETATVADGSYIGGAAGPGDTAHINDGTVTTLDGVGFKLVGTGDSVSAQRPQGWHRIAA